MTRLGLFALVVSVLISVSTQDITITYDCNADSIDIHLDSLTNTITYSAAIGQTVGSSTDCKRNLAPLQPDAEEQNITLSQCTFPGEWVMYLMEPNTDFEDKLGVGSFSKYTLSCQPTNATVTKSATVNSTAAPIQLEPTIELTMDIAPKQIFLGGKVIVTITETGTVKHKLSLTDCIASPNNGTGATPITLVSNGTIQQQDLVNTINSSTNGIITMTLYGFRFVADPTVNLSCTVKICEPSSKTCQTGAAQGDSGKRGLIKGHSDRPRLRTVKGAFTVLPE